MLSNLDRYKKDLNSLLARGEVLLLAIQVESLPEFANQLKKQYKEKAVEILKTTPNFTESYQAWYSEARAVVKQLLPDRLSDFVGYYETCLSG